MDWNTYQILAMNTEASAPHGLVAEVGIHPARMVHASIGLSTESAELLDAVKKMLFYGKPLDTVNVLEEIGDICWYLAILCDALNIDLEKDVLDKNIAKLKSRYPNKFSCNNAINRDLTKERAVLEA